MIPFEELCAALDRFNGRQPGRMPVAAAPEAVGAGDDEGMTSPSPEEMAALGHAPEGEEILAAGGEPEHAHDEAAHAGHHDDAGEPTPAPLPPLVIESGDQREDTTGEIDVNDLIDA